MLTMTRPVVIPFRWLGHGLDLRMHARDGVTFFSADDVMLGMEYTVDLDDLGIDTVIIPGLTTPAGTPLQFLTVDAVYELHRHVPMYLENGFIDWFGQLLDTHAISHDHLQRLIEGALPEEPGHADTTRPVADAARILKRDHGIDLGQERLFRAMNALGWTDRDNTGIWVPRPEPLRAGYLVRRNVRVPQRHGLYPQILVTNAGILALAELLAEPAPTDMELA